MKNQVRCIASIFYLADKCHIHENEKLAELKKLTSITSNTVGIYQRHVLCLFFPP